MARPPDPAGLDQLAKELRAAALPSPPRRRLIRVTAGASLRDLAALLDTTPETIRRWELGTTPRRPRAVAYRRVLERLAEVDVEVSS